MNISPIIFARMSSSRLPGKALIEVHGRPLLSYTIARARNIHHAGSVILATSLDKSDDVLEKYAENEGLQIFRGGLQNVAQRALECAEHFNLDGFIRICGDRPFFDVGIVNSLLDMFISTGPDLVTNVQKKTYPAGMTVEIITTDAMRRACAEMAGDEDKEHVTRYFYQHPEKFKIHNVISPTPEDADLSFVVDTRHDLDTANWLVNELGVDVDVAPMQKMVSLLKQRLLHHA